MSWTPEQISDQSGKSFLITGGNSGLGFHSARLLAAAGARVIIACRDQNKGERALQDIRAQVPHAQIELRLMDLADLESIKRFSSELLSSETKLDVLINNAGVMAPPLQRTKDGFEMQFGTNHLGHFALTGQLLPLLNTASEPRVVTVSSVASHIGKIRFDDPNWNKGYSPWLAYGQSKLANLMFALELQRRSGNLGGKLQSFAVHPGYAATNLQDDMFGGKIFNTLFAQSAESGAYPSLLAATSADVKAGAFYGPKVLGMWGSPHQAYIRCAAKNAEDARKLWQLSEQLTGVVYKS